MARAVAAELDELGYAALWLSAGFGQGLPAVFGDLLDATVRMSVASGILSIWHATAAQAAQGFAALERARPGWFLLGLSASHVLRVDARPEEVRAAVEPDGRLPRRVGRRAAGRPA